MRRPGIFWHESLIKLIWNQTISICSSVGREKRTPDGKKRMLVYKSIELIWRFKLAVKQTLYESRARNRETNCITWTEKEFGHWKIRALFSLHHNLPLRMEYSNAIFNISSNKVKINNQALLWCDISVRRTELTQASNHNSWSSCKLNYTQ